MPTKKKVSKKRVIITQADMKRGYKDVDGTRIKLNPVKGDVITLNSLFDRVAKLEKTQNVLVKGFKKLADTTKHLFGFGGVSVAFRDVFKEAKGDE